MGPPTTLLALSVAIALGFYFRYYRGEGSTIVSETLQSEYDYIVVGAGSAGSVVAARLAEDTDNTVLLLEAGGHYDESKYFHIPFKFALAWNTEYDWKYYTEGEENIFQSLKEEKSFWPRGRVVGGSSVLNTMQYTRGSPFDFDEWAAQGCKGWDYKSVLPYFLKSEDILIDDLKSSPYHSQGGPLAVSYSPPSGLTPIFLKAGQELGYDITDYNGKDQEGFSIIQSTIRNGVRSSTGLEFLGKTKKANLDIGIRSFVTKVEITDKVASGVYYIRNSRKHFVKARKEVILSGGSINSPQLLMLSGVGPSAHLRELGIPVKMDLPVGQYLKDHQVLIMPSRTNVSLGLTTDTIQCPVSELLYNIFGKGPLVSSGLDTGAFIHLDKAKRGKTYPDIQFIMMQYLITSNGFNLKETAAETVLEKNTDQPGFTIAICSTRPKSIGSLKLRSKDPFDPPVIRAGYFDDEEDIKTMIGGIRVWEKLIQSQTMRFIGVDINQLKGATCSEHEFRSDAFWECFIRHTSTTDYHHSGSCRMGPSSEPLSVVDPELRVRGISNLRVVDASVFHDVTSGNINAPTIMIAEKAADMIRGIDSVASIRNKLFL